MDRTSNQSILSTDYYTRFLVFHATQTTGTIFKLNKIWRLNQKGSGRQMTPQFIFMVKVLLHTVLSVTFEMRIQGYSTNQDQSFVIRGKEKKKKSTKQFCSFTNESIRQTEATSEAGLSIQQEPSGSNKGTYNESVYRDFIQF